MYHGDKLVYFEIDRKGFLSIARRGILRPQYCTQLQGKRCGDWCPNFREPEKDNWCYNHKDSGIVDLLILCDDRIGGKLIDLRETGDLLNPEPEPLPPKPPKPSKKKPASS